AVEQVLRGIVCGIADEGLGVDDEPGLALGSQDIAGVQIGGQQHFDRRRPRQLLEEAETLADQAFVGPVLRIGQRLFTPMVQQRSRVRSAWGKRSSHSARSGELRQLAARCAGIVKAIASRAGGPEARPTDYFPRLMSGSTFLKPAGTANCASSTGACEKLLS